jgi:hypothetical protein
LRKSEKFSEIEVDLVENNVEKWKRINITAERVKISVKVKNNSQETRIKTK